VPNFFIDRPVFAWIVALAIVFAGALAISQLPVAQYPRLAPTRIIIDATYPGAITETVDETVGSIIEESLDGAEGMLYYETSSDSLGELEIIATFAPGTNPDIALVDVQNRIKQVETRLPSQVVQQGINVFKSANTFLMLVALTSADGSRDPAELSDYLSRYVMRELKRTPGVGSAQLWDADEALRIWLDPMKLREYGLAAADVNAAITTQNAAVTAGTIGDTPLVDGQPLTASVSLKGQLISPDEFGQIVLKAKTDGSAVHLSDVARIEIGRDNYAFWSRLNGKPAAAVGIQLGPRGNALETSGLIRAKLAELSKQLPPGMSIEIPFDNAHFVHVAIHEVVITLCEAVVLVFLVMWLFLRNLRYALVPTVVIPVTLMGAFGAMYACGLSINTFTMLGLVLAIGILVDDAIVVVESVHRVMAEEDLSPRAATRKSMAQISGALIGVAAVLTAVFVPMAFFPGGVGGIYRQFAIAMIASMLVSSFMALSLTPALCANLLKTTSTTRGRTTASVAMRSFPTRAADGFERSVDQASRHYRLMTSRILRRVGPMLMLYAGLVVVCALMVWRMPGGFLPAEDQGQLQVMIQLPAGATQARTLAVVKRVEQILSRQPEISNVTSVMGWSFSGSGQNVAMAFVELKEWDKRDLDARVLRDRLSREFDRILDGNVEVQLPPSVPGLGHSDGFVFRLEDRGGLGRTALTNAREQLAAQAKADPVLASVHFEDLPDAPRVAIDVDRAKAYAFGVPFERIADVLGDTFGSSYVDDFPAGGRMRRVIVAGQASSRMSADDLLSLSVPNQSGAMVSLSALATLRWAKGPVVLNRYDGYPSLDINGRAASGHQSGEALEEMERLAAALPRGFAFDWVDAAREESGATRQTSLLIGLSLVAVFMVLAALYESWVVPLAVMMVIPLGVAGAVAAVLMRGISNDIYFKLGLITVIGLSAKNAILIVQFARDLHGRGIPLKRAIVEASAMRFRPIVMTSMAFLLGVMPLMVSSGAGAESRHSIGTSVFGGVITATLLGLVFTPLAFYCMVRVTSLRPRHVQEAYSDDKDARMVLWREGEKERL
jgi:hydrophobic/amphiphilic exporter-1 (mainly G- bacteria), HAE1 family